MDTCDIVITPERLYHNIIIIIMGHILCIVLYRIGISPFNSYHYSGVSLYFRLLVDMF